MDKRIPGFIHRDENEKRRLRHEHIIRQFKEFIAQETLEDQMKNEFHQNGRDFEYLPEFETPGLQRPLIGNILTSPIRAPNERANLFEDYICSPSASTNPDSGSPLSSTLSNYFSFASPLLSQSAKDDVDAHKTPTNRQLFGCSSPLAKPITSFMPEPMKKSVATQTDDIVNVNNNNNKNNGLLTSSVFKSAARETVQKFKTKMYCAFCMKNKDHERVYTSHNLKDAEGRVTCPVLRNYVCPRCGATGDVAHTISYCTSSVVKF